jgi:GntR family transcriptional regulator
MLTEDKIEAMPKYQRIARDIVTAIKSGKIKQGDRTLSENEIIAQYKVSNTTARKALQEVEHEGWVTKIKGKGAFVRTDAVERRINKILSFTRNMIQSGRQPGTRVLDSRIIKSDYSAMINGRQYTVKAPVFKINRLRLADGAPMMLETRYISMTLCPGIDKKNLAGSLYEIYEREYGLHLARIEQTLGVEMMGSAVAGLFDIQEPAPAFRVEGVTFCGKDLVLEMELSLYHGKEYKFVVEAR